MISIESALEEIRAWARPLPVRKLPLRTALGCRLVGAIAADLDLPPFPKALVDGYAIRAADYGVTGGIFRVIETVPAGHSPSRSLGSGETSLLMTGAPMPHGADAVVMREYARHDSVEVVRLTPPKPIVGGQNWMPRGRELLKGEIVLNNTLLGPAQIGLLASVGRAEVNVRPRPQVTVIPTGDELVEPACLPGPGQIRNSNGPLLTAYLRGCGAEVDGAAIAPDEPRMLRSALERGIEKADLVVVAGGVSAGDHDLVPATLKNLGVREIFHKVHLKPGKPLWFGVSAVRGDGSHTLVFGLPGNPVGAAVCARLFVATAINRIRGISDDGPGQVRGRLAKQFTHRGDRPTYHPARLHGFEESLLPEIEPLDWAGSADLRTLAMADGFACFPAPSGTRSMLEERIYASGSEIAFLAFP